MKKLRAGAGYSRASAWYGKCNVAARFSIIYIMRQTGSAIGQAPAPSPHPAILLRDLVMAVKPSHVLCSALDECGCERRLRRGVAHAFAGKYDDPREACGRTFAAAPRDAEEGPST